ncbi:MAG TPA: signal peptidase I [Terracidiphilus sp.]|nr:signal peptidase I [Terracidiphilus sp.]
MTKKKTAAGKQPAQAQSGPAMAEYDEAPENEVIEETPFEAVASICSVLVVGLFILTFLAQNYVIPSGSMENTLLVGDHLLVDRITVAPPTKWMPLVHYREPKRGDVIVFYKPAPEPQLDSEGKPQYFILVKRLIGMPGDHIHLHHGIVSINGVAQAQPYAQPTTDDNYSQFLDDFPAVPPGPTVGAVDTWSLAFPNYVKDGDLVVPPGMFFMMGDNRHNSFDSRYWGFVPRANVVGRPLFNYWSFVTPEDQYDRTGLTDRLGWMLHVATHFISDTRWKRTFHMIR